MRHLALLLSSLRRAAPWSSALPLAVLALAPVALSDPPANRGAEDGPMPGGDAAGQVERNLPPGVSIRHELPGLRTARTRTYVTDDNRRFTKVFMTPVNYRAANGQWEAIDTTLEATAGDRLRVKAAGYGLGLPKQLGSGGVRLTSGPESLEFAPIGARSVAAETEGARARFEGAYPNADLVYSARPGGVKESIMLRSAEAAAAYEFSVEAGSLQARSRPDGGVEFVARSGEAAFTATPPYMRDAAGKVSSDVRYELSKTGTGYRLDVKADPGWLSDPKRQFPVELDPSFYTDPQRDCFLDGQATTTSFCGHDYMEVGWNGSHDHRSLLKFDLSSSIPKGALVHESYFALFHEATSTSLSKPLAVNRLTRDWTSSATWNKYDGTNNWTTAGGDFDASRNWLLKHLGDDPVDQYYYWAISSLVQGWVDGDFANNGLVLKDRDNAEDNNVLEFASSEDSDPDKRPFLGVTWSHRPGLARQFSTLDQRLSDRMSASVNVANGNLTVLQSDLAINGTGLGLNVSRAYNSGRDERVHTQVGWGWQLSGGMGARLEEQGNGDQLYTDPTGARHLFELQVEEFTDDWYHSPTGVDATLTTDGAGHELKFDKVAETYEFNSDGDLTAHRDRNGNEIAYSYSSPGELSQITDTQGRTVSATYDGNDDLDDLTDSTGRDVLYAHDAWGQLTSFTDADDNVTSYVYDDDDRLIEIEDARGTVTRFEYDADGRITELKRDYDRDYETYLARWQFSYQSPTSPCAGTDISKTVVTDPRGKTTTYCHDTELRATKVVDPNGNTRSATYTPNSDPATITAPGSAVTTFGYDSTAIDDGPNLTSADEPGGEESLASYDTGHPRFPSLMTNPQGSTTAFVYDTVGNTETVSDGGSPTQVEASLEYNGTPTNACVNDATTKPGTLRCAIDGNGNTTNYGYDDDGNLISITPESPLGDIEITYDALSRVQTVEDGKNQTRTFTYDPIDRVTEIEYSNSDTIAFDYDESGNLLERDDSVHGVTTFEYDALNRRTEDDLPSGTNTYAYDAADNLTSLTDPTGTITYGYDDANRLTKLAEPGGSCTGTISLCTTFGYSTRDQRTTTTYPNTVVQTVTYDSSDKPTRIRAIKPGPPEVELTDFQYTYNRTSPARETYLRDTVTDKDGNTTDYEYDFLDRLDSATEKNSSSVVIDTRSYDYDAASNRTKQIVNGTTTSYGYDAANQLCWEYTGTSTNACGSPPGGATTYTHDANGNTTASSAGLSLSYNIKDHTTSYTPPGGSATSLAYAGPGQAERTSLGGTTQHNTALGLTREGTSTSWVRDTSGMLVAQKVSSTRHYYLTDALGSIVGLTNSTGTLAQSYKYDPYGTVTSSTGSVTNPFQFAGGYRHHGLHHFGQRYYSTSIGRWTQPDPLDQAGDLRNGNRYIYVGSDPINFVDPTGEIAPGAAIAIGSFAVKVAFQAAKTKEGRARIGAAFAAQFPRLSQRLLQQLANPHKGSPQRNDIERAIDILKQFFN